MCGLRILRLSNCNRYKISVLEKPCILRGFSFRKSVFALYAEVELFAVFKFH
jgi:hypothetical protein